MVDSFVHLVSGGAIGEKVACVGRFNFNCLQGSAGRALIHKLHRLPKFTSCYTAGVVIITASVVVIGMVHWVSSSRIYIIHEILHRKQYLITNRITIYPTENTLI